MDKEEINESPSVRVCPGHERALPIESTVMSLDVREEGKNRTTFWEGKGDRATITILFVSLNEQI